MPSEETPDTAYTYLQAKYASRAQWDMSMGLQAVDGLEVSSYLQELAEENISGACDFQRIAVLLEEQRQRYAQKSHEADIVASRIAEIIASQAFSFRPSAFLSLHRFLFLDVFPFAGKVRECNIAKKEPVLAGTSVVYAHWTEIHDNLEYDFEHEAKKSYAQDAVVTCQRIASFARNIWQTHPFLEGNTRTVAVFLTKYLQTKGFNVKYAIFAENARFFRNALVRACYADYTHGIAEESSHLEKFFANALFGSEHPLRTRDLICYPLFAKDDPAAIFRETPRKA